MKGLRSLTSSVAILAALCALPAVSHAQGGGAVSGSVADSAGRPLRGVLVAVRATGLSVRTNATGQYTLARVPVGAQVLEFRRIGYGRLAVEIAVRAGQALTVDAVLTPQAVELAAITVTGVSLAPDRLIDAPAAVEVVQPGVAKGMTLTDQIPQALQRVPGLDVVQSGVNDFNINARGFNTGLSNKVLVVQDGRDLSVALGGSQAWSLLALPLEDLGRIEVIRGPGSALYGANAFNGVINITTPMARDLVGTRITLGGGQLGTLRGDLRHAGVSPNGRIGYRVNLGYTRSDDWSRSRTTLAEWQEEYEPTGVTPESPGPEAVPLIGQTTESGTGAALGTPDPLVNRYGSARLDYYAAGGSIVTLEGGWAQADNAVVIAFTGRNQYPKISRPWARFAWNANGTTLSAWYSGLSIPEGFTTLTSGQTVFDDENVFQLEARHSRTFGADVARVTVGASARQSHIDTRGSILEPTEDNRSDQVYSAYAQVDYRLLPTLSVVGAARFDNGDLFDSRFSPKVALVFTPVPNQVFRVGVNRAFLPPTVVDLFLASPIAVIPLDALEAGFRASPLGPALAAVPDGTLFTNSAAVPMTALGNLQLVPQTVTSFEVGYKGQFGRRVFVTVDGYRSRTENFRTGLLPVGSGVNPAFQAWTAPSAVPEAARAALVDAVQGALQGADPLLASTLTRLPNGATAFVFSFGNTGTVDEWGVEVGINAQVTDAVSLSGSYTRFKSTVVQNLADNVLSANTPDNKGTLAIDYVGGLGITLSVAARFVESYRWTDGVWDGPIPATQTIDVTGGYQITPHVRASFAATNLLNHRRYQIFGGSLIGRRMLVGLTTTF